MESWTSKDGKKITANRSRPHRVVLRLSDEELEKFRELADAAGMTQQEYGRKAILNQKVTNTDGVKELLPQLGRIGSNLNQIAAALNSTRYYKYELITENQKELKEIWQSLKQFLQKLP